MNYRKIRKNVKAISPVISVLMMIAIAVVGSLVLYGWFMGYISFEMNDFESSLKWYDQALQLARQMNDNFNLSFQLYNTADLLYKLGRQDEALNNIWMD